MKKYLVAVLALMVGVQAFAAKEEAVKQRFLLNNVHPREARLGKVVTDSMKHVLRGRWDLTSDQTGLSAAAIALYDPDGDRLVLPADAVVTKIWIESVVAPTAGGGSTVNISIGSTLNPSHLVTAFPIALLPAAGGFLAPLNGPNGSTYTFTRLSSSNDSTLAIKTSVNTPLTGKLNIFFEYIQSDSQ